MFAAFNSMVIRTQGDFVEERTVKIRPRVQAKQHALVRRTRNELCL